MKLISISVAHLNTTHTGIRIAKVFITDLAPGTTLPSPGVPVPRCGLKRQMLSIQSVLRPNQLAETRYQSLLYIYIYRDFNHFANGDTMPLKGAEESTVRELLQVSFKRANTFIFGHIIVIKICTDLFTIFYPFPRKKGASRSFPTSHNFTWLTSTRPH